MSSRGASDELPSSSVSGPRFADATSLNFERPVSRVGRYRVLSELGRGGMSNVFLAVASGPGGVNKLVVLKALLPDLSAEPYALTMFLDEARLAAQLNHPNVVQTYEVGTEGDRHVIVMEYLEGQSLSAISKRAEHSGAPLPGALQLRVIINALEGLHYAHELRAYDGAPLDLVHRDISPQNVFVTYDGQVKVLDFGIAKAATSSTHTATGVVKGKIAYMAPEQTIGDAIDRRADIYSVGCMLWATATGKKLWKDTPDVHIMRRVINGDIPSPQTVNPGCDDELDRIVTRALASDPNQRYQTALELQHDLEVYSEHLGTSVKQKDIGRYVSELFADTRAQLKALVERQLTLLQADESNSRETGLPAIRNPLSTTGGVSSTGEHASWAPTIVAEGFQASPKQGRGGLWVSLALAASLALLGAAYFLKQPPASAGAVAQPATAAPPAPAPTAASSVTIEFRATPAEAKLFLDDQPLPSNPATKVFAIGDGTHKLRAEAEGFAASSSEFSPTRDTALELTLAPTPEAALLIAPSSRRGSGRIRAVQVPVPVPSASAASKPAVAPKPVCDAPFFIDKDGIRKVRPECM